MHAWFPSAARLLDLQHRRLLGIGAAACTGRGGLERRKPRTLARTLPLSRARSQARHSLCVRLRGCSHEPRRSNAV
eukprot:6206650-Pleurochrysis_carterae.AAC.1